MKTLKTFFLLSGLLLCFFFPQDSKAQNFVPMRGIVLSVEDLETVDWPKLAAENHINTIGTHITPSQVLTFIQSQKGERFLNECRRYNIDVEHQLHALHDLLPRDLFEKDSTLFRMDENGRRVADFNCCANSEKALNIIAEKAAYYAKLLPATNHRYYFWLDDNKPICHCPECSKYSASEQALLIENRIIKELRKYDSKAQLAHLAYYATMKAPQKIKPEPGIFLEFAPYERVLSEPLSNLNAIGRDNKTHAELLNDLHDNLKVFPIETAVVLEYWLDVSLASKYKKPAVQIPWKSDVFKSDIKTYSQLGLKNITTFGVYMDKDYFKRYPNTAYLKEYGQFMSSYDKRWK